MIATLYVDKTQCNLPADKNCSILVGNKQKSFLDSYFVIYIEKKRHFKILGQMMSKDDWNAC